MTLAAMSFGSQLSNSRTGSSHDTSVEVCEEESAHVSLSESLVEVQSMLVLFYQNVGVLGALLQGYSSPKWKFSDMLYMTFFLQIKNNPSL